MMANARPCICHDRLRGQHGVRESSANARRYLDRLSYQYILVLVATAPIRTVGCSAEAHISHRTALFSICLSLVLYVDAHSLIHIFNTRSHISHIVLLFAHLSVVIDLFTLAYNLQEKIALWRREIFGREGGIISTLGSHPTRLRRALSNEFFGGYATTLDG
jgi:hypothetical protein